MATLQEVLSRFGQESDTVKTAKEVATPLEAYFRDSAQAFVDIMRNRIDSENANAGFLLRQGLGFNPEIKSAEGYSVQFTSEEDYVNFRNEGVSGVETSRETPYAFKSIYPSTQMVEDIATWMNAKGYTAPPWAVATNIKKHGFDGIHFIEEAFSEENLNLFNNGILTVMSNTINNIFERVIPEFKP
jgi:hypothetical protein